MYFGRSNLHIVYKLNNEAIQQVAKQRKKILVIVAIAIAI